MNLMFNLKLINICIITCMTYTIKFLNEKNNKNNNTGYASSKTANYVSIMNDILSIHNLFEIDRR